MASRVFNVPISLVSFVDLGRQWFLSNHGLGEVRETPRDQAFCAHSIAISHDLMIIRDTLQDARFQNNPLVSGEPNIRFYAGAPLVSPEGAKLGTFCIIDSKPRRNEFSYLEKQNLTEFAGMAMDRLNARMKEVKRDRNGNLERTIACTAHDMLTPLSGIQMSLQLVNADTALMQHLDEHQKELIDIASTSSRLLTRICYKAIDDYRQESNSNMVKVSAMELEEGEGILNVAKLVRNLHKVIEAYHKRVPLTLSVDELVPPVILADDLQIFRCALNYLTRACDHTETGFIHLRMYVKEIKGMKHLLLECEDTGESIDVEKYPDLFEASAADSHDGDNLNLYSVSNIMRDIGGDCGFHPREQIVSDHGSNGSLSVTSVTTSAFLRQEKRQAPDRKDEPPANGVGSIFWLSIPLIVPSSAASQQHDEKLKSRNSLYRSSSVSSFPNLAGARKKMRVGGSREMLDGDTNASQTPISGEKPYFPTKNEKQYSYMGWIRSKPPSKKTAEAPKTAEAGANAGGTEGTTEGAIEATVRAAQDTVRPSSKNAPSAAEPAPPPAEPAPPLAGLAPPPARSASPPIPASASPPAPPLPAAPAAEPAPSSDARARKAIVIDDSLTIRKSIGRALSRVGFDVTFACNGLEGLDALKETLFDIVLCDFLMPIMDGLDCVQQYRAWETLHRPYFRQYIVGISAHATETDSDKGLKVGMDKFLSKPISLKTLQALSACDKIRSKSKVLDELHVETQKIQGETMDTAETLSSPENSTGLVCLIADDAKGATKNLARFIESAGFRTSVVDNGEDALRLLKMRQWNIVLLDSYMPKLTGARCVLKFREWEGNNRVSRADNIFLMCNHATKTATDRITVYPRGMSLLACRGSFFRPKT
uniref:Response regulatory domain-containing protein n=1 Tax=Corethron hystrix TaxID=216773 RepID=A0A7S1BMN6_9STRA